MTSTDSKAQKQIHQSDSYYKEKANFDYLKQYGLKIIQQLGRGGYGVVYKAVNLSHPDTEYAIKINFNTISRQLIYAEMAFLQLTKGQSRLPELVCVFLHEHVPHIVLNYFKYQPFISYFHLFTIEDAKHYLYELLLGLRNLKNLGIYHRDIKPANFLYDTTTKRGMIIDFGLAETDIYFVETLAQQLNHEEDEEKRDKLARRLRIYLRIGQCLSIVGRNKIGTETYMPIEALLHDSNQDYSSDIWPVGVIMLQLVAKKLSIFNGVKLHAKINGIRNDYFITNLIELANFFGRQVIVQCRKLGYDLQLPKGIETVEFSDIAVIYGYDQIAADLMISLLSLDHEKRITVQHALQHPFFDSVRHLHMD